MNVESAWTRGGGWVIPDGLARDLVREEDALSDEERGRIVHALLSLAMGNRATIPTAFRMARECFMGYVENMRAARCQYEAHKANMAKRKAGRDRKGADDPPVSGGEESTAGATSSRGKARGAVSETRGAVSETKGAVSETRGAVSETKGAVSDRKEEKDGKEVNGMKDGMNFLSVEEKEERERRGADAEQGADIEGLEGLADWLDGASEEWQ